MTDSEAFPAGRRVGGSSGVGCWPGAVLRRSGGVCVWAWQPDATLKNPLGVATGQVNAGA